MEKITVGNDGAIWGEMRDHPKVTLFMIKIDEPDPILVIVLGLLLLSVASFDLFSSDPISTDYIFNGPPNFNSREATGSQGTIEKRGNDTNPNFRTPTWEVGDYWVLVREADHIAMDESADQRTTYHYEDEKRLTVTSVESVATSSGTFECYKLSLLGRVRASGEGVQTIGGVKVNFRFDLDAPVNGEIWLRTSDLAFVKVHIETDGYANTDTILGKVHQYQNIHMEYDKPEQTFGLPLFPGASGTYDNDIHVTGVINIEGQTNGDEEVDEYHHVDSGRKITEGKTSITVPTGTYFSGEPYPLGGDKLDTWKITGLDKNGYHDDGDEIDPPPGGKITSYFSPKTGFYVKQEVENLWTAWASVDEYIVRSEEVLTDYSYRSEKPVIVSTDSDPVRNDGEDTGNISVKIEDKDGLLDIREVYADLSSLGSNDRADMLDDGTHGDEVRGDGIYTLNGISTEFAPLIYFLPVTISDWSDNIVTGNIEIRIVDFRDAPPLIRSVEANPPAIRNNNEEKSLIKVAVEDDMGIKRVSMSLGPIGGGGDVRMYDDGTHGDEYADDSIFSLSVRAGRNCSGGAKVLEVSVEDTGNNVITGHVSLLILEWNHAPKIMPRPTEKIRNDGEDVLLIVAEVTDEENNLEEVSVDLSSIGGDENARMYDDGTHGDEIGSDGAYSLATTVWKNYSLDRLVLPLTARDSAGAVALTEMVVRIDQIGTPPELFNPYVSSSVRNDGEDIALISINYYDKDRNINWITINLAGLGVSVPRGMLLEKGTATIEFTVGREVEPGRYNLTISAMDLDWKSTTMVVKLRVVSGIETNGNKDTDRDGMSDEWEEKYGMDSLNPADAQEDWDNDGRTNLEEYNRNTNPISSYRGPVFADSDFDGMPDRWEKRYGLDPFYSNDANEDENRNGKTNLEEYLNGTDPVLVVKSGEVGGSLIIKETSVSERELDRWADNILIIMTINGMFLLFSIILFFLERRWRKKSIIEGESVTRKQFVELKEGMEAKIDDQNALMKELIDAMNEHALTKEKVSMTAETVEDGKE